MNQDEYCKDDNNSLSECGCCEAITKLTPAYIWNPPGLPSIAYRVGTHSQFKNSMIASLGQQSALQNLTTREDNDPAIALLGSWAVIADVLTFYQERIANEGFLRTATERRSVLELARTVGYELRPGVAASTFLTFTVDPAVEKKIILINAGTKVQSLPGAGETPQIFETVDEIEASAEWNELKPRQTHRQNISTETSRFHFKGRKTLLKPGDLLMVVQGHGQQQAVPKFLKLVNRIEEDAELDHTIVHVTDPQQQQQRRKRNSQTIFVSDFATTKVSFDALPRQIDLTKIRTGELKQLASYKWSETDLNLFEATYDLSASEYAEYVNENAERSKPVVSEDVRVYTFRVRAGIFGNSAPRLDTLPLEGPITDSYKKDTGGQDVSLVEAVSSSFPSASTASQMVYLDNNYPSLTPSSGEIDSWVLLQSPDVIEDEKIHAYQIKDTREETRSKFLLTFKSTGLEISNPNNESLAGFKVRNTTAFAKSELLELAEVPILEPIGDSKTITLDHALLNKLSKGKLVSVSGEIVDTDDITLGIQKNEVATIDYSELDGIYTALTFTDNLNNRYKRDSFVLNANVSRATHGESKEVVLGGGDSSQSNQEFMLKESPLTYILASTSTGVASTLEVRVDGILWHETPSILSPRADERRYRVRIEEGGHAKIIFGDGIHGMRPASGTENIKAKYRIGLGEVGLLKPGQISLLMSKPLGVRGVTNSIAPTGAADPENLNSARKNSVVPVLTMERIVSVEDVERFALAFAGVGKSQATLVWDDDKRIIRLTIASAQGDVVEPESDLYMKLSQAINKHKDPSIRVRIDRFDKILFNIEANVAVEKDRLLKDVFEAIREALLTRFSFKSMQFNLPVTLSQVVATIQSVGGVAAVDVDELFTLNQNTQEENPVVNNNNNNNKPNPIVPEVLEYASADESPPPPPPAWLITLNPDGLILREMQL